MLEGQRFVSFGDIAGSLKVRHLKYLIWQLENMGKDLCEGDANCAFFFRSDSSATMHLIKALLVLAEHTLSSAVCGSAVAWHPTELGGILLEQLQLFDHEASIQLRPRAIRDGRLLASTSWVATWEVLLCCVRGRSVQTCFGLLGRWEFSPN